MKCVNRNCGNVELWGTDCIYSDKCTGFKGEPVKPAPADADAGRTHCDCGSNDVKYDHRDEVHRCQACGTYW